MTDYAPEHDDDQQEQDEQQSSRRQKAREREEQAARLATAERELAVFKAGIPGLKPEQAAALAKVHDGDLTPDALRETASTLGWGSPPEDTTIPPSEAESHQKAADAAAGGGAPPDDPIAKLDRMDAESGLEGIKAWAQEQGVGLA